MVNDTKNYPKGWTDIVMVDASEWQTENWESRIEHILEWLERHPDTSRFAWERPMTTFVFESSEVAEWFSLRWAS